MDLEDNILERGIYRKDGYTATFQIISAFVIGFILSPFSFGLLILIISAIIWEIVYAAKLNFVYDNKTLLLRATIFLIAFLGWYIGRLAHGDSAPLRGSFGNKTFHKKLCKKCTKKKDLELRNELEKLITNCN